MLMARSLDHEANRISEGLYGLRTFAFTDNLDVINRLYFSLLDAEGRNNRGDPDPVRHPNGPLASLRRVVESRGRDRYGQNWRMPEVIGHRLDERKRIGRTSSQDPGVANNADVIVATASLEVGFNDPAVGAIIQHKAPRSAAQFLQRKGRAGRRRGMRPWTAIILSDYGRDRLAYQAYERLFDPVLPPQSLPISSRHIRRIQAVYALIDYLGLNGPDGRSRGQRPPPGPPRLDRKDHALNLLSFAFEYLDQGRCLLSRQLAWQRQAYQACRAQALLEGELAEVLVLGDQYAPLGHGQGDHRVIGRSRARGSRHAHVMACRSQCIADDR